MIQKPYHDPIPGIGGKHSYRYSSYWSPVFTGHIHLAAKETGSSVLAPVLLFKIKLATFWMTGILHGKGALTALLGYCSILTHEKMLFHGQNIFVIWKICMNMLKHKAFKLFLFCFMYVFQSPVLFAYSNYHIFGVNSIIY